jgi:hypothetical protein
MGSNEEYLQPVYGWAMNFGTGYTRQPNIFFKSSLQTPGHEVKPFVFSTGPRYMSRSPFYQLGPQNPSPPNCPYYNYTLPDTYPEVANTPQINPRAYWYLPYDTFDWADYNNTPVVQVPKP